jgi:hypothetical protein
MAQASDIVGVTPLTSTILVVQYDDGYAIHHKRGQHRTDESMVVTPLDVAKAMEANRYALSSSDDGNYASALSPLSIGRKSKPTEFALMCQSYNQGCINTDPDHAKEHWVYLFLPHALQPGKTYSLRLDNITGAVETKNFTYVEETLHSEAIHVNNIGYSTTAPAKYGYVYHWLGDKGSLDLTSFDGKPFKLYDVTNSKYVFTGSIAFRKSKNNIETGQAGETPNGNFASADVYECDFSAFNTPGTYRLVVPGIGSSFTFELNADAYHEAFYWTMKGLYQNRSGIALTAPYTDFPRPVPHHPKSTPGFAGRLKYSTFRTFDMKTYDGDAAADKSRIEAGYKGTLENTYGWYQDAGDWDGYHTHANIPAFLLFLYEAGKDKFTDGELDIPESGNGLPDVLDEAAWLLRYFKRAKDEVKQKGWGTGGVPGARVFGDLWGGDERADGTTKASWEDTDRDWYVLGEDPWMSYKYAAMAGQLAVIMQQNNFTDPQGVNWKQEAIDAYTWAVANTRNGDDAPANHNGADIRYYRMYASASLYRLTGEDTYHQKFKQDIRQSSAAYDPGSPEEMFGGWMYLLAGSRQRDEQALEAVKQAIGQSGAVHLLSAAEGRAARWGGNYYFPMLVGQGSTPMVTPGVYAYLLNKDNVQGTNLLKYLHTTADYYLGCNPLNLTWISGVGERHPVGLFHLDWWYRDKADPNNSYPVIKGVVPYGPWRYDTSLGDLGWWNPNWAYSDKAGNARIYPADVNQWPGHERWFDMRVSPLSSEFTIHQNTVIAAFVYGFLSAGDATTLETGTVLSTEEPMTLLEKTARVFPNPASESITVEVLNKFSIQRVELLNAEGKRMRNVEVKKTKQTAELDIRHQATGVYFVRITTSDGQSVACKVNITR